METVRILHGRAGQVWAPMLREIASQRARGLKVMLLVPEQYTLQAERDLMEDLRLNGLYELDVVSPSRLRNLIREFGGSAGRTALNDQGRLMTMAWVLTRMEKDLLYYHHATGSPGLVQAMADQLMEMKQAGVKPEQLRQCREDLPEGTVRNKLHDLLAVWELYEETIGSRFMDEEDQNEDLLARLPVSGVLKNTCLWIYGFDALPRFLWQLTAQAAACAAEVTVTMTAGATDDPDREIFLAQHASMKRLEDYLTYAGVPWMQDMWRETPGSATDATKRDPAIDWLEKRLFSGQGEPLTGETNAVSLMMAPDPFTEAMAAAATLSDWHEAGIPWESMGVAMADEGLMTGPLETALRSAGIPCYLSRRTDARRHGFCRMLTASVRAVTQGWRQKDVLTVARSGFSPLEERDGMRLENYALENGIDRRKWLSPLTRGKDAADLEPLRAALIAPLQELAEALRQAVDASASVTALVAYLEKIGAREKLEQRETRLLAAGMMTEAAENRQVWRAVLELLEQLWALLGGNRALMKELPALLEAGLQTMTVGTLPPEAECVMAGAAGHLMTGRLQALLVVGLQDEGGESRDVGLLSEPERALILQRTGLQVGTPVSERASLHMTDLYRTLSLPERYLRISWSASGLSGEALRGSGLITEIRRLLPDMKTAGGTGRDSLQTRPLSPEVALDGLAVRAKEMREGVRYGLEDEWEEAFQCLWYSDGWGDRLKRMLDRLGNTVGDERISPENALPLLLRDGLTVSRLETFASCPYRYFIEYGLRPEERKPYAFEATDKGDFFHAVMERYAREAAKADPRWPKIPAEQSAVVLDRVLDDLCATWENGPLTEDAYGRGIGGDAKRIVRTAAMMLTRQYANSNFRPCGSEVRFGGGPDELPALKLDLPDGESVILRGSIDRVDRCEGQDGDYYRVLDFKSSHNELKPVMMQNGVQLQVMMYLAAVTENIPDAIPAGGFYYAVQEPYVAGSLERPEEARKEFEKKMRLDGVVLAEPEVLDAMNTQDKELSIANVLKKDGTIRATASAVDREEMDALLRGSKESASDVACMMRDGHIEVYPAKGKTYNPCARCCRTLCRHHPDRDPVRMMDDEHVDFHSLAALHKRYQGRI